MDRLASKRLGSLGPAQRRREVEIDCRDSDLAKQPRKARRARRQETNDHDAARDTQRQMRLAISHAMSRAKPSRLGPNLHPSSMETAELTGSHRNIARCAERPPVAHRPCERDKAADRLECNAPECRCRRP